MTGRKSRFSYAVEAAETAQKAESEKIAVQEEKAVIKKPTVKEKRESKGQVKVIAEKADTAVQAPIAAPGTAADALKNPADYALPPQRRGWRGNRGEEEGIVKRMDIPREQLNIRIRPELKRAAASLAALNGLSLGDVIEAALIDYIEKSKV